MDYKTTFIANFEDNIKISTKSVQLVNVRSTVAGGTDTGFHNGVLRVNLGRKNSTTLIGTGNIGIT